MALGEEWRRYTPDVVDPRLCMGRTWNDARGGQCRKSRKHGDLCEVHHKSLACGRVDGLIPEEKMKEFRRKRQVSKAEQESVRAKDGESSARVREVVAQAPVQSTGADSSVSASRYVGKRKSRDEESVLHEELHNDRKRLRALENLTEIAEASRLRAG